MGNPPFVPQFKQQQIPITGGGGATSIQDPLQEAARLVALIVERRGREKRARTERRGVRAAGVAERGEAAQTLATARVTAAQTLATERAGVRADQLRERQAANLLDLASGQTINSPEAAAAFRLRFGRAPNDKEVIGGPRAEFGRRLAVGMVTQLDDPELFARFAQTAAVLAVAPRGVLVTAEGARALADVEVDQAVFTSGNIDAAERVFASLPEEDRDKVRAFLTTQLVPGQFDLMELDVNLRTNIISSGLDVVNDPKNKLALLIEEATGLSIGDIVGASAVGINQLLSVVFNLGQTPSDFEETRNNVIQELSSRYSISPALMRRAFDLKDAGVLRDQVPISVRPAYDALDAGASASMQAALGSAFKDSSQFQVVRSMIELGRQVDPRSNTFAELATLYTSLMKFSLLEQSPNFESLRQDLRSDNLEISENAARELQERINELDIAVPSFGHITGIPLFREKGTEVTGGKPISELRSDVDQLIAELERLGLDLDEPEEEIIP